MFRFLLVLCIFLSPLAASAHWPVLLEDVGQNDVEIVPNPAQSRAYYGSLTGYAHSYEFTLPATTTVFIQTLLPDLNTDSELVKPTGLLVEKLPTGRVAEVVRLYPDEADWESEFEPFGGDRYLQGPVYEEELPPGEYLFEVSTPDNNSKYVVAIGREEEWRGTNPFVLLGRIYQVKQFFEKPWYAVWQSPFYYLPTLFLLLGLSVWQIRRRFCAQAQEEDFAK